MWLSGLRASLQTKGSLVGFPVGSHAWVVGPGPSGGRGAKYIGVSLPHFLPPFPSLKNQ